MELRYLPAGGKENALKLIPLAVEKLREDYRLNITEQRFQHFPGRELSFEEFLVMLIIEKDFVSRLGRL